MTHFAVQRLARLVLYATLAQGALACGADSDHSPPIGAPTGPLPPVVVGDGGSFNSGGQGGGDAPFAGSYNAGGFGGDGFGVGGSGTAGSDPFGIGGSDSDPFGFGGTPSGFSGGSF